MGELVGINVESQEQLTLGFISRYREAMGLPPADNPQSLLEGLGEGVKLYRYREPGRQFALTGSDAIKDSLMKAGAGNALPYKPCPEAETHWDVGLPSYLWAFI